jgi:hypothetical protein
VCGVNVSLRKELLRTLKSSKTALRTSALIFRDLEAGWKWLNLSEITRTVWSVRSGKASNLDWLTCCDPWAWSLEHSLSSGDRQPWRSDIPAPVLVFCLQRRQRRKYCFTEISRWECREHFNDGVT